MVILTNSGRVAMAQPIHLAWGSGNAAWDTTPLPESIDAETLLAKVGRRKTTYVNYCEPDEAGEIIVPSENSKKLRHLPSIFICASGLISPMRLLLLSASLPCL